MARTRAERVVVILSSPRGGRVTVHPDRVDHYLSRGYRTLDAATDDGRPKGNASRDEWAAYADSLGVEYAEDAKREEIKAAVDAASEK